MIFLKVDTSEGAPLPASPSVTASLLRRRSRAGRNGHCQRAVDRQTVGAAARDICKFLHLPLRGDCDSCRQCALLLECRLELLGDDLRRGRAVTSRRHYRNSRDDRHEHGCTVQYRRTVLVGHERFRLVCRIGADPPA